MKECRIGRCVTTAMSSACLTRQSDAYSSLLKELKEVHGQPKDDANQHHIQAEVAAGPHLHMGQLSLTTKLDRATNHTQDQLALSAA